jgi:hypothetical protein
MSEETDGQRAILVVEDDSSLYEAIKLHLSRYGWKCEWFAYADRGVHEEIRLIEHGSQFIDDAVDPALAELDYFVAVFVFGTVELMN